MEKLKLNLNKLEVESFETDISKTKIGTVAGNLQEFDLKSGQTYEETCNQVTCEVSCPTCNISCPFNNCGFPQTIGHSCECPKTI